MRHGSNGCTSIQGHQRGSSAGVTYRSGASVRWFPFIYKHDELSFTTAQQAWSLISFLLNRMGCEWKAKHAECWSKVTAKGRGQQDLTLQEIPQGSSESQTQEMRAMRLWWCSVCQGSYLLLRIYVPSGAVSSEELWPVNEVQQPQTKQQEKAKYGTVALLCPLMTQMCHGKNRLCAKRYEQTERKESMLNKQLLFLNFGPKHGLFCLDVVRVWILHS